MNDCFKLIKLDLKHLDLTRIKGEFDETYGNVFLQYKIKDLNYLENEIKNQIKFLIPPDCVSYAEVVDDGLSPHIDTCSTVLNYYFQTPPCYTYFFKLINDSKPKMITSDKDGLSRESGVFEWNLEDVEIKEKLCAENHSAYLLNTHQIHCVHKLDKIMTRSMIRWIWMNAPFKIIERSIQTL